MKKPNAKLRRPGGHIHTGLIILRSNLLVAEDIINKMCRESSLTPRERAKIIHMRSHVARACGHVESLEQSFHPDKSN